MTQHIVAFTQAPTTQGRISYPAALPGPPYPYSQVIESIVWHWTTYANAAPGSDLWPVAWGPDNHLYAAWGDGGRFGGSDRPRRSLTRSNQSGYEDCL